MPTSPERARDLRLQRQYGITAEQYDEILVFQGGVCAICKKPPKKNRLSVDHNHKTGLTRGLLCWACNKLIAQSGDSAVVLDRARAYLTYPPVTLVLGAEVFGRTGRVTNRRPKRRKKRTPTKRS